MTSSQQRMLEYISGYYWKWPLVHCRPVHEKLAIWVRWDYSPGEAWGSQFSIWKHVLEIPNAIGNALFERSPSLLTKAFLQKLLGFARRCHVSQVLALARRWIIETTVRPKSSKSRDGFGQVERTRKRKYTLRSDTGRKQSNSVKAGGVDNINIVFWEVLELALSLDLTSYLRPNS